MSMRFTHRHLVDFAVIGLCAVAVPCCKREERSFRVPPPAAELSESIPYYNDVRPGPVVSGTPSTSQPVDLQRVLHEPYGSQFPKNAQAMSDGQLLYESYNCSGCHAHGGGGMGPPLLDNKWFYGSNPSDVYQSIAEGRPNGMPSFRGRIPDNQIWELTAYVRSLSGQASQSAAGGREEHMTAQPPPNSMPKENPEKVPEPTTGPAKGSATGQIAAPTTRPGTEPTSEPATKPAGSQ